MLAANKPTLEGPRKWSSLDFTCDELRNAWLSYTRAIEHIEKTIQNTTAKQSFKDVLNKLIAAHREKLAVLERAQRIINTSEAIARQSRKIGTDSVIQAVCETTTPVL